MIGPTRKPTTRFYSDDRNFYKVEKWTKDGTKIDRLLYAGKQSRQSAGRFCEGDKAPAADQADDPAANSGTGSVAAEVRRHRPLC